MRLNRVTKTIGFRLALLYAGLFSVSVILLFGIVYFVTSSALHDGIRHVVSSEIASLSDEFDEDGVREVKAEIELRLASGRRPTTYYFLLSPEGDRLAGTLVDATLIEGWHDVRRSVMVGSADDDEGALEEHNLVAFGLKFQDGSFLVVAEDSFRVVEAEEAIIRAFAIALVVIVILGFGGGILLSSGFLRRIDDISRTSQMIVTGSLADRIPTRGTGDELDRLADGLNEMFDRLQALIESLKQVSNDIAHDLRTPLSRLRQKLEGIQGRELSTTEYKAAIDRAILDVDAILQTFAALLRIAQIESGTRKAAFTTVDLSILFRSIHETYAAVAEDNHQRLLCDIEDGILVHGDKELLMQMLANLIENAIRHCPAGAKIQLSLEQGNRGAIGEVSDNGSGIPPSERGKVFRRFYRLEDSRTTAGNGLGLALVAAVAEVHHIKVSLNDNNPGLIVRLEFPSSTSHQ